MNRYFGITIMAASIAMLSLGTIPQSFAGTTSETSDLTASMVLGATCGVTVTGPQVDYGSFQVGTTETAATQVTNSGTVVATLDANAGTPSAISNGGGFAAVSDGITHINPSSIRLNLAAQGFTPLSDAGTDVTIGSLTTGPSNLAVETTATIVNPPVVDPSLTATIALTASC